MSAPEFKRGDTVVIMDGGRYVAETKIVRVTPSGLLVTADGTQWKPNGWERKAGRYRLLVLVTEANAEEIERLRLLRGISDARSWLTYAGPEAVAAIPLDRLRAVHVGLTAATRAIRGEGWP